MPAKRRTVNSAVVHSPQSDDGSGIKDETAYRLKRKRNNDAVKKARAKSKETANERKKHVEKLRRQNENLEGEIKEKKKNVQYLKDLLLNNVKTEDQDAMIKQILDEQTDDDNEDEDKLSTIAN